MPFYPFWGEGFATKVDYSKKEKTPVGTLIFLTSSRGFVGFVREEDIKKLEPGRLSCNTCGALV